MADSLLLNFTYSYAALTIRVGINLGSLAFVKTHQYFATSSTRML